MPEDAATWFGLGLVVLALVVAAIVSRMFLDAGAAALYGALGL